MNLTNNKNYYIIDIQRLFGLNFEEYGTLKFKIALCVHNGELITNVTGLRFAPNLIELLDNDNNTLFVINTSSGATRDKTFISFKFDSLNGDYPTPILSATGLLDYIHSYDSMVTYGLSVDDTSSINPSCRIKINEVGLETPSDETIPVTIPEIHELPFVVEMFTETGVSLYRGTRQVILKLSDITLDTYEDIDVTSLCNFEETNDYVKITCDYPILLVDIPFMDIKNKSITTEQLYFDDPDLIIKAKSPNPVNVSYGDEVSITLLRTDDFYFTEDSCREYERLSREQDEQYYPNEPSFSNIVCTLDEFGNLVVTYSGVYRTFDAYSGLWTTLERIKQDLFVKDSPTITYDLIGCTADEYPSTFGYGKELELFIDVDESFSEINPIVEITMDGVDISERYEVGAGYLNIPHVTGNLVIKIHYTETRSLTFKDRNGNTKYTYTGYYLIDRILVSVVDGNTIVYINGVEEARWEEELEENETLYGYGEDGDGLILAKNLLIKNFNFSATPILEPIIVEEVEPSTDLTLNLYQLTGEKNQVDKTNFLQPIMALTGTLRESCSITRPIIKCEFANVPSFNYVYIPNFNRYYFVDEIVFVSKNIYNISLRVDVLMTYQNEIKSQTAIVARNEFDFNDMLVDAKRKVSNDKYVEFEEIEMYRENMGFEFNEDSQYIVAVVRGSY